MMLAGGLVLSPIQSVAETRMEFGDKVRAYLLENPEVILEVMDLLSSRQSELATKILLAPHLDILFETEIDLRIGRVDADRVIVEFFDYNCAVCMANVPTMRAFVAANPDVAIVKKHLPILSPGSERAVRFVLAAREIYGSEIYANLHAAIYAKLGPLSLQRLSGFADDLELDVASIEAQMQSSDITAVIETHRHIAIGLNVLGTPTFASKGALHVGKVTPEILMRLSVGS